MQAADPLVPARADLFNQMRAISDPNSQLEVLAYDLTASELDAFAESQEPRQNTSASFGPIGKTSGVLDRLCDLFLWKDHELSLNTKKLKILNNQIYHQIRISYDQKNIN